MSWNSYPVPEALPPDAEPIPHAPEPHNGYTPTFLEMVAFFTLAAILITLTQGLSAAIAIHWHLFGRISLRKLAYQPRFTIPAMVVSYGIVALATVALYRRVWPDGFLAGIHWNFSQVRRYALWLPALGIGLGLPCNWFPTTCPFPKNCLSTPSSRTRSTRGSSHCSASSSHPSAKKSPSADFSIPRFVRGQAASSPPS